MKKEAGRRNKEEEIRKKGEERMKNEEGRRE